MKKILRIAQFEFLEKIKTKSFFVFTIIFPVIAVILNIFPEIILKNFGHNGLGSHVDYLKIFESFSSAYITSLILIMFLFMLILFSGGMMIRSLVEEKSNRIIEILLSSCSAHELLSGKILGLSLLGIFQLLIWYLLTLGFIYLGYIPKNFFNNIGVISVYFILGYILFTAIFVGVGSVINTEQEAQQFNTYLSMVMITPLLLTINIIQEPNSEIARLLSYFPLTAPPVMILRVRTEHLPFMEIFYTMLILIFSIYITITISAKIFKVGILAYGKHPAISEIFHWFGEK